MTTNKPEIVAWFKPASDATLNSVDVVITDRSMKDRPEISAVGFTEPLVRLSDYEVLEAERDALVEALEDIGASWHCAGTRLEKYLQARARNALAAYRKGGEV